MCNVPLCVCVMYLCVCVMYLSLSLLGVQEDDAAPPIIELEVQEPGGTLEHVTVLISLLETTYPIFLPMLVEKMEKMMPAIIDTHTHLQ